MALTHTHYSGLLAPFALGNLDGADASALKRHLRGCAQCQAELKKMLHAAQGLSQGLAPLEPPLALRQRLLDALQAPPVELVACTGPVLQDQGRLSTGPNGLASWRVAGQAVVTLLGQSVARLQRAAQGLELRLDQGSAMVQVQSGTPFQTILPLGLVQVKGTYFFVESHGPRESYVCLCEGWLALSAPGLITELRGTDHQAVRLRLQGGKTLVEQADPEHAEPDLPEL